MKKNILFLVLFLLSVIAPVSKASATDTRYVNPNRKHYIYNVDDDVCGYFTGDPANASLSISRFDIKCTPYNESFKTTFHVETFSHYVFCMYDKKGNPVLFPHWYFEGDQIYSSKVYRPTARK